MHDTETQLLQSPRSPHFAQKTDSLCFFVQPQFDQRLWTLNSFSPCVLSHKSAPGLAVADTLCKMMNARV